MLKYPVFSVRQLANWMLNQIFGFGFRSEEIEPIFSRIKAENVAFNMDHSLFGWMILNSEITSGTWSNGKPISVDYLLRGRFSSHCAIRIFLNFWNIPVVRPISLRPIDIHWCAINHNLFSTSITYMIHRCFVYGILRFHNRKKKSLYQPAITIYRQFNLIAIDHAYKIRMNPWNEHGQFSADFVTGSTHIKTVNMQKSNNKKEKYSYSQSDRNIKSM